jgi:putative PIN family toxin of toxin-antitoxin system
MNAPQAVIDTNVLLDFWVFDDARSAPLRSALEEGSVCALRSAACVDEFSEVLARPLFRVDSTARCEILRRWHALAKPLEHIVASPFSCSDPHDQKFLDLAYSAGADWLVTKDKSLLRLASRAHRAGLHIVEPATAAVLLEGR